MTYKCYDHVTLGENVTIEDYAINVIEVIKSLKDSKELT